MPSVNTKGYPARSKWICEKVAAGASLEAACGEPGMPELNTVRRWLMESPDFRRRYLRARKLKAERLVDQVVEIADGLKDGAGEAEARRQRLRIEARKWAVAQFNAGQPFAEPEEPAALPPPPRFKAN